MALFLNHLSNAHMVEIEPRLLQYHIKVPATTRKLWSCGEDWV